MKYLAESDTDKVRRWKGGCSWTKKTQKGFYGNRNMGHGKGKKVCELRVDDLRTISAVAEI